MKVRLAITVPAEVRDVIAQQARRQGMLCPAGYLRRALMQQLARDGSAIPYEIWQGSPPARRRSRKQAA